MPTRRIAHHADFDLLLSLRDAGGLFAALREAEGSELHVQRLLRQQFPDELVPAAITLAELRRKAAVKFSRAGEMWFDRRSLEQATSEPVARHKAKRFAPVGQQNQSRPAVWDLCCGTGGDTLALAAHSDVVAVDREPAACLRTLWNAAAYGVDSRVHPVCADVRDVDLSGGLVHIDPDRRAGGRRSIRLEAAEPGLDFLSSLTHSARGGAIKLSPAANFGGKFPESEIELISLHGECKEATVWFGELGEPGLWRATVLPSGETLAGRPLDSVAEIAPPQVSIYDPDPSIVRSGLVDLLAVTLGLSRLDDAEEYLTSDAPCDSPFLQTFELLADLPNNTRAIRRAVREQGFGQIEIKARHIPIDAAAIRRRLPLEGSTSGVLIYARVAGKARVLVCRRMSG